MFEIRNRWLCLQPKGVRLPEIFAVMLKQAWKPLNAPTALLEFLLEKILKRDRKRERERERNKADLENCTTILVLDFRPAPL